MNTEGEALARLTIREMIPSSDTACDRPDVQETPISTVENNLGQSTWCLDNTLTYTSVSSKFDDLTKFQTVDESQKEKDLLQTDEGTAYYCVTKLKENLLLTRVALLIFQTPASISSS